MSNDCMFELDTDMDTVMTIHTLCAEGYLQASTSCYGMTDMHIVRELFSDLLLACKKPNIIRRCSDVLRPLTHQSPLYMQTSFHTSRCGYGVMFYTKVSNLVLLNIS